MAHRARWKYGASCLVLSLIISSAAFAATESAVQETPSQADPESKSYLPPWMQGERDHETAGATSAAQTGKSAVIADRESAKRKARARKARERAAQPKGFMRGFAQLFGQ